MKGDKSIASDLSDGEKFENSVGRVLGILFDKCKIIKSTLVQITKSGDPNEIDFIIEFDRDVFLFEVTIDSSLKKARNDMEKMRAFRRVSVPREAASLDKNVHGYYILPSTPSAHILDYAKESGQWISAMSLNQFISKFCGAREYLEKRKNKEFGSVRHPNNDTIHLNRDCYVDIPIVNRKDKTRANVDQIISKILNNSINRLVLTGDFGVGKSMLFREIFYKLSDSFESGKSQLVPIYLNARSVSFQDHNEPIDVIEDHLKWVGCRSILDKFTALWPNGNIVVIIDGFDEYLRDMPSVNGHAEVAIASTSFIRKFLNEAPETTPILICGRESYFDSNQRTLDSMMGTNSYLHYSTSDMTDKHIRMILAKYYRMSRAQIMPDWLPWRPLLLTYIFGFLANPDSASGEAVNNQALDGLQSIGPGEGWNKLIEKICMRDAQTRQVGGDALKSRRLLEFLSIKTRDAGFKGVLEQSDIISAYRHIYESSSTNYDVRTVMRHCGLVPATTELTRRFIDETFTSALVGGALIYTLDFAVNRSYVDSDPLFKLYSLCGVPLDSVSLEVSEDILSKERHKNSILDKYFDVFTNPTCPSQLTGDLMALLLHITETGDQIIRGQYDDIKVSSACFGEVDFCNEHLNLPNVKFSNCVFEAIYLEVDAAAFLNKFSFESCIVQELILFPEYKWTLTDNIQGLSAEKRKLSAETNADILNSDMPFGIKHLRVCSNKLYDQSRNGRKVNAFYRGGVVSEAKELIDEILRDLCAKGYAYQVKRGSKSPILHPTKQGKYWFQSAKWEDDAHIDDLLLKYKNWND